MTRVHDDSRLRKGVLLRRRGLFLEVACHVFLAR